MFIIYIFRPEWPCLFSLTNLSQIPIPKLGESLRQIRQNIRPWSEFVNIQNFKTVANIQRLTNRLLRNLAHFQSNYLIICVVLLMYCLWVILSLWCMIWKRNKLIKTAIVNGFFQINITANIDSNVGKYVRLLQDKTSRDSNYRIQETIEYESTVPHCKYSHCTPSVFGWRWSCNVLGHRWVTNDWIECLLWKLDFFQLLGCLLMRLESWSLKSIDF